MLLVHPAILAYAGRVALAGERPTQGQVPVVGIPGVRALDVRTWTSPTAEGFEIRGLVGERAGLRALKHPVVVRTGDVDPDNLTPPAVGRAIRTEHAVWYEVPDGDARLEVERLDGDREVLREVPRTHDYAMSCPRCRRLRYAPRRVIAIITCCRVCAHEDRCARRAASHRTAYAPDVERATREQLRAHARELRAQRLDYKTIARLCGRSISWVSRTLRAAP